MEEGRACGTLVLHAMTADRALTARQVLTAMLVLDILGVEAHHAELLKLLITTAVDVEPLAPNASWMTGELVLPR